MSKKRKRRRWASPTNATNKHHLCFQGRHWSRGSARALRNAFVRSVPVSVHIELHERLHDVPLPPGDMTYSALRKYRENKAEIDTYDVVTAAQWLYDNIPDGRFRVAMQFQIRYFAAFRRAYDN